VRSRLHRLGPPPLLAVALLLAHPAPAFPDAPPWGHHGAPGDPDCTACHFDATAVEPSPALRVEGLPERVEAGASYRITIRLDAAGARAAGLLLVAAHAGEPRDAAPAGDFEAVDARTQARGAAARSTAAGSRPTERGDLVWTVVWHAPQRLAGPVVLYLAANAANGDASPFGDTIHLRKVRLTPPADRAR